MNHLTEGNASGSKPRRKTRRLILVHANRASKARGLMRCLKAVAEVRACKHTKTLTELFEALRELRPDLAVLFVNSTRRGLNVAADIRAVSPGVKVLVVSPSHDPSFVAAVLDTGAGGYAHAGESVEELVEAARDVANGLVYVSASIVEKTESHGPAQGKGRLARSR